ncbi:MAG: peptidase M19 [Acetobacteraceae bacterium]|nr:peptidase M19 [Acetobacteraceae bacterium]
MSSACAANSPAARIGAKSGGTWMVTLRLSAPPSICLSRLSYLGAIYPAPQDAQHNLNPQGLAAAESPVQPIGMIPTPMIIDMHTHAGRIRRNGPVDRAVLATLRAGQMGAAVVSAIADLPVIRRNPTTRALEKIRDPEPGECMAAVDEYLAAFESTGIRIAREPGEITIADPALVLAVEGCDFLEGDLDRLDALAKRGVRSIQLTHYLVNETGDIQTAPPVHGGLTKFGADVVRRMNQCGIMVDAAHCSEDTVRGIVDTSSKPILCTHANLLEPGHPNGLHKRFISLDYARMVAGTGGVIGGWIAVLWDEKFAGLIRHIFRLIDAVGIDHVGIGTDMPSGAAQTEMPDFSRHIAIAAALREGGLNAEDIQKVCSENWLRVFRAARS